MLVIILLYRRKAFIQYSVDIIIVFKLIYGIIRPAYPSITIYRPFYSLYYVLQQIDLQQLLLQVLYQQMVLQLVIIGLSLVYSYHLFIFGQKACKRLSHDAESTIGLINNNQLKAFLLILLYGLFSTLLRSCHYINYSAGYYLNTIYRPFLSSLLFECILALLELV